MQYTQGEDSSRAMDSASGNSPREIVAQSPEAGRGGSTGTPPAQPSRLHFPDGSSRLETDSPLVGLRAVAAAAAFGIAELDAAESRVFVTVTEISTSKPRPSDVDPKEKKARKGKESAEGKPRALEKPRHHVIAKLIAAPDNLFQSRAEKLCATPAEIRTAKKVRATRNTDPRTKKGREIRSSVGRSVREIRSR